MSVILDVVLPVFAIIIAGFLAGRARLLGAEASAALNQFVYWFALPPVIFLGLARRPLDQALNGPFVVAFLGAMLLVYALAWGWGWAQGRERRAVLALQALNACFPNTGYMGIPLFLAAFGPGGLAPAILATVLNSAVMIALAVAMLEMDRSAGAGTARALRDAGRALLRNPLVMASVAGALWSLAGLPVPRPLINFGELLGAAAGPAALFAIGLFLSARPLGVDIMRKGDDGSGGAGIGWIVALKLVGQPLLTWWIGAGFLPIDAAWMRAAILLAALPTGSLTFVLAQHYGVYVERSSAVVLVSTVLSMATLSALLALLT
jgi:predicted permease